MLAAKIGFGLLTLICFLLIDHYFFGKHLSAEKRLCFRKRYRMTAIGWLVISGVLAFSGFFQDFTSIPPPFILLIGLPLIGFILVFRSKSFKNYVREIPPHHIIALQTFRVPVEILLWMLYLNEGIPIQMTFEECNMDVITGLTAPLMAYLFYRFGNRKIAVLWNLLGMALLINIVTIAIISTPLINYFPDRIPNTAIALLHCLLAGLSRANGLLPAFSVHTAADGETIKEIGGPKCSITQKVTANSLVNRNLVLNQTNGIIAQLPFIRKR